MMCEHCNVCACFEESPERSLERRLKKIKSDTKNLERRRDSLIDKLTRLRKEAPLSGSCNQKTRSPLKWLDARDAALLPPKERSPEEVKRAEKRVFGQASEQQGEFHTSLFVQTLDETLGLTATLGWMSVYRRGRSCTEGRIGLFLH
jgi:hypothetical protein